jgi:hybrid cluster-associated redox disulfide protein
MTEFTKDTLISEVLTAAPETEGLFLSIGMHCLHCVMASGENIEQACAVHGVDVDNFLDALNNYVAEHA